MLKKVKHKIAFCAELPIVGAPEEKWWRGIEEGGHWDQVGQPMSPVACLINTVTEGGTHLGFKTHVTAHKVVLFALRNGNPTHVARVVQIFFKQFRSMSNVYDHFTFSWAAICNFPKPGAFGGGTVTVTHASIVNKTTWDEESKVTETKESAT